MPLCLKPLQVPSRECLLMNKPPNNKPQLNKDIKMSDMIRPTTSSNYKLGIVVIEQYLNLGRDGGYQPEMITIGDYIAAFRKHDIQYETIMFWHKKSIETIGAMSNIIELDDSSFGMDERLLELVAEMEGEF